MNELLEYFLLYVQMHIFFTLYNNNKKNNLLNYTWPYLLTWWATSTLRMCCIYGVWDTHTVWERSSAVQCLSLGSTALEQTMQHSYLSLRITAADINSAAFQRAHVQQKVFLQHCLNHNFVSNTSTSLNDTATCIYRILSAHGRIRSSPS